MMLRKIQDDDVFDDRLAICDSYTGIHIRTEALSGASCEYELARLYQTGFR
jgi:hypothetical protein